MLSTFLGKVKEVSQQGCPVSAGGFSVGLAGYCRTVLLHVYCTIAASHPGTYYWHVQAFPTCSVPVATAYSRSHQAAV